MSGEFPLSGKNAAALFTLKVHRGDGMALLAMNWKDGKPQWQHLQGINTL